MVHQVLASCVQGPGQRGDKLSEAYVQAHTLAGYDGLIFSDIGLGALSDFKIRPCSWRPSRMVPTIDRPMSTIRHAMPLRIISATRATVSAMGHSVGDGPHC